MSIILIIDDSPTEVLVFKRLLEREGYTVLSAHSAEEGLSEARTKKPDLVLMDVVMPGMDGFRATRKLTRDPLTKSIPVIMITTKDQETDRIWGLRQGARDYVVKPPDETAFLQTVRETLDHGHNA